MRKDGVAKRGNESCNSPNAVAETVALIVERVIV